MKQELKKMFPDMPDHICDFIENCLFFLKTKAMMQYNFSFDGEFDNLSDDEGMAKLKTDFEERKSKFIIDLNKMRAGLIDMGVPEKHRTTSAFGSLINTITKEYLSGLVLINHYDELFKTVSNLEVIQLSLDLMNLQFASTVLRLPFDQVTEKLDYCLNLLVNTHYFKDLDEMKNHTLNLSKFMDPIIQDHIDFHDFFISKVGDISQTKLTADDNEPGNSSKSNETVNPSGRT